MKELFASRLLSWHRKYAFRFPWRETRNPYKILIAEVLLRKTTRSQVNGIFEKFIKKYPTPQSLASAKISSLEKILEPLGMQKKRSGLLIKLGKCIVNKHSGRVPKNLNELRKIPGVGLYTSNAVLCLVYNKHLPLVDTNTIRVIERVFQIKSRKARARTDPELWSFAESLIPEGKARKVNLAIIDFANLVCTQKSPKCSTCLLTDMCMYPDKTNRGLF